MYKGWLGMVGGHYDALDLFASSSLHDLSAQLLLLFGECFLHPCLWMAP